jgi:hypothetical protein
MSILAVALAVSAVSYTPPPAIQHDAIRKIMCDQGQGTAFVIADGVLVSAEHVTENTGCFDLLTKQEIRTYHTDSLRDFSLSYMDTTGIVPMKYSCKRFRTGKSYYTFGYGAGRYMVNHLIGGKAYSPDDLSVGGQMGGWGGMRLLSGLMIGGQSGGPITDAKGIVHGINNVSNSYNIAYSYELADTVLCKRPR